MADGISRANTRFSQAETDRLRALALSRLAYDPGTGLLVWKSCAAPQVRAGSVAGSLNKDDGYIRVSLDNKAFKAHRLIWLMVYGRWPSVMIDHCNLERADNRLENLREATCSQNMVNTRRCRNGLKGAYLIEGKSRWYSRSNGRHLGCFATEQEAHEAYVKATKERYGEFARTG